MKTITPRVDFVFHRLQPWTKSNSSITNYKCHKENGFNHYLQRHNWIRGDQMDVALPLRVSSLVK
jgi:hypothetical protein